MQLDAVHTRVYHDWSIVDSNLFYDPVTGFNKKPIGLWAPYAAVHACCRLDYTARGRI